MRSWGARMSKEEGMRAVAWRPCRLDRLDDGKKEAMKRRYFAMNF